MADWPDEGVPVIDRVTGTVVFRGDEPFLRALMFDPAVNVRRADIGPAAAWELTEILLNYLRAVTK